MSTSNRNIHLFLPGLCSLVILSRESQAQKTEECEVLIPGLSLHEGKMEKIMAATFHFFIKYQQLSYYTNSWYCHFLLMSQLLSLIKIMNTFTAKFIVYFSVFTFLMFPVNFLSYIHLFIKYLMRTDTALDAGSTVVRKTHVVLSSDDRTKQPQQCGKSYMRGITGHMIRSRGLEPSLITFF